MKVNFIIGRSETDTMFIVEIAVDYIKRNIKEFIERGKRKMIKCPDCNKFGACDKASEDVIECLDFKKQSYNTKLVKVDGLNYKFEEVK